MCAREALREPRIFLLFGIESVFSGGFVAIPPGRLTPEKMKQLSDEDLHEVKIQGRPGSDRWEWATAEQERRKVLKENEPPKPKVADRPHSVTLVLTGVTIVLALISLWVNLRKQSPQGLVNSASDVPKTEVGTTTEKKMEESGEFTQLQMLGTASGWDYIIRFGAGQKPIRNAVARIYYIGELPHQIDYGQWRHQSDYGQWRRPFGPKMETRISLEPGEIRELWIGHVPTEGKRVPFTPYGDGGFELKVLKALPLDVELIGEGYFKRFHFVIYPSKDEESIPCLSYKENYVPC